MTYTMQPPDLKRLKEKAIRFLELHHTGRILVLPNAWDVPSARIFENAGFPAIATTSGGVSVSLGYPDGENISRDEMLSAVSRIASSVSVPVSADMESGFGNTAREVAETARRVITAGAIGLNIEDSSKKKHGQLIDPSVQAENIKAVKRVAQSMDVPLVVNARTDAFRYASGDANNRLSEVVRRGKLYIEAGADCIFAFGVRDAESISRIVKELNFPVNIIAGAETPTISELEKIGVARASLASGPARAAYGLVKRIAQELREDGTYDALTSGAITHQELNELAVPRKSVTD